MVGWIGELLIKDILSLDTRHPDSLVVFSDCVHPWGQ